MRPAPAKTYTLMWVPERSSRVRRLTLSRRRLQGLGLCGGLGLLIFGLAAGQYVHLLRLAGQSQQLRHTNLELRAQLDGMQGELRRIDGTLQEIDRFIRRVQTIHQLRDPARNLAMGLQPSPAAGSPEVLYAKGERLDVADEAMDSKLAVRLLDADLEAVGDRARETVESARALHDGFAEDDVRLRQTPSIRPTRSHLLISGFGERVDPYTDRRVMHKGIDFAADHGSEVIAPADGAVLFAGHRGCGLGNVLVLDHGLGYQTHYAHLESFAVQPGQTVERGGRIATVGTSGRTTAAHLHYEVRYLGVPTDPQRFIFD
jgi:murein DD-endopeptidase MepM/ murein hydrolase activator NlpD